MICNKTQNIIDTLLRFNDSSTATKYGNINKIASFLMTKPKHKWCKDDKATICASVISQMMDKDNQNKVASTIKIMGEVAELESLINLYYR